MFSIKDPISYRRAYLPACLAVLIVLIYILRLFYLQILSPDYKAKADRNAFYEQIIYPDRGAIYDRNGQLLVYNEPAYDVMVTMHETNGIDTAALSQLIHISKGWISKRFSEIKDRRVNPGYSPYTPQLLLSQLSAIEAGRLQEQLFKFPGFSIRPRSVRRTACDNAALLLGYLGETNPMELEKDSSLVAGEYVGKSGIERYYDADLRGEKGIEVLLRDARGRIQGSYNQGKMDRAEIPGRNLTLGIDIELQALGERLMQGKRGAIVMIEPSTGEILCAVSAPSYNPNLLTGRDRGKNHKILEQQTGKPLLNRAIMGAYPPGSTFKVAQTGVFLQEGVVTPETRLACHHGYPLLRGKPACHGHVSPVAAEFALTTSCNAYYCWCMHYFLDDRSRYSSVQEAFEVWKNRIVDLGMGYRLGVDLPGERRGYVPNSQVYDKIYNKRWRSSSIISISIGQGEVLLTPLQMANLAAIVANRGYYYRPHVVSQIEGKAQDTLYTKPVFSGVEARYWEVVARGMAGAVTSGTCRAANFAPGEIVVCGKTGTAENAQGKDHSAFIGFAPKDNPQVAIAVYVEHGGFGARFGVPIGRVMMEYYLRQGKLSAHAQALAHSISRTSILY